MPEALKSSEFRVEKTRKAVVLTLSTRETIRGNFFVAGANPHLTGPERVGDLLNAEEGFLPFEVLGDSGGHTVLYNRAQILTVALPDNEASLDPGYDVATRRMISVGLSNGERVSGAVRVYRPGGRDRVSDWGRHGEQFRYLETAEVTLIVNVAHVIDVREVFES